MENQVIIVLAFAVTWLSTRLLIRLLISRRILDTPNARSSHNVPTPRGGGIGILLGLAAAVAAAYMFGLPVMGLPILAATAIVGTAGAIDDTFGGIPPLIRLVIQTCAAFWVVSNSGGLSRFPLPSPLDLRLGSAGMALAIVWIVAVCNFYNFLDGIDGYAATQGLLAALGFLLLGYDGLATTSLALIGACSGFLIYNWHPARVFMGDVGSGGLGFLLAAAPFSLPPGPRETAVFAAGLFLWFFLSDGLFTLIGRLARREKIWTAHRSHLYQRLVATGMTHQSVVFTVGAAAIPLTLLAAHSCRSHEAVLQWICLFLGLLGFFTYVFWTRMQEARAMVAGREGFDRSRTTSAGSPPEEKLNQNNVLRGFRLHRLK